ncbi:hypothetical protein W04_1100 [Pseudoalteromonas sp. SW0106-04]|nr:hypothetical protein W04_1100 [Pseudoalteromonas sp. SW0106-04]
MTSGVLREHYRIFGKYSVLKKKIIIHAGPGKTGTSAIQSWLSSNIELLKSHGIHYPAHEVDSNSVSSGNLLKVLKSDGKHWVVDEVKLKQLVSAFESSKCEVLLLSSEHFYSVIEELHRMLPEAKFLLYFRNPVDMLESNYNQGVKRHGFTHKFSPPEKIGTGYLERFKSLLSLLGTNHLFVRSYDLANQFDGGVVEDFLSFLGLDVKPERKKINASYTLEALELKRQLNVFELEPLDARELDKLLQGYNQGLVGYSLFSESQYLTLQQSCHEQLRELFRKYDLHSLQKSLSVYQSPPDKNFVSQYVSKERLSEVVDYIYKNDQCLFENIHNELASLLYNPLRSSDIYHCFNVTPPSPPPLLLDRMVEQVVSSLPIAEENKSKVAVRMAHYFLGELDFTRAIKFLSVAINMEPHVEKYNEALAKAYNLRRKSIKKKNLRKERLFGLISKLLNLR